MHERSFKRAMARNQRSTRSYLYIDLVSILLDSSALIYATVIYGLINPIVKRHGPSRIILYIISQFQARHLTLTQDIMQSRCADAQLLCYPSLFLFIILHPRCKLIHATPLFDSFFRINISCSRERIFLRTFFFYSKKKVL